MRPFISCRTASAVVGLGRPDRLALGAAIGTPAMRIISRHTSWAGHLSATRESPPVARSGTRADFSKVMVNGPGQKVSIKVCSKGVICRTKRCTID